MASTCLEQRLGVSVPLRRAALTPRVTAQRVRVYPGNRASMVGPGQGIYIHSRSRKQVVSASKHKRSSILDLDDDDDDDDDDFDGEGIGILDMEEWAKNKPSGFGGKVYDTSLEERLLEEIERDKIAQAAAKAAAKNKKPPVKPAKKADSAPPAGVEVFVGNLPKKRNVDRDLRAAVRSASGLLHIRPLVLGNDKTREPVCKGLAFLTFATLEDAEHFVYRYNGESLPFGKVQKKISCELAKSSSPYKGTSHPQSSNGPRLGVRDPLSGDLSSGVPAPNPSSGGLMVGTEEASDLNCSVEISSELDLELTVDQAEEELELEEDDLSALEQQIWDELENDEDFEIDMELEVDESSDTLAESTEEESVLSQVSDRRMQGSQRVVENLASAPTTLPIRQNKAESGTRGDVRQESDGGQSEPQSSGQGFGRIERAGERFEGSVLPPKKSVGGVDDKEKRIKELEAKLEELQSQLSKRNSMEFSKPKESKVSVRDQELKIEALEKRLLARAKAGQRDSNVSNGKPAPANSKPLVSKSPAPERETKSKDKQARPQQRLKLGAASRLRKREREIFSEALSKYSAPSRD